jgi:hypothetical protein
MRRELFLPSAESEARLLLLISAFSVGEGLLEGRTKLAKLDFLLRYPSFLRKALEIRGARKIAREMEAPPTIEGRMVKYRYGPWDPSYYALLGRLVGKKLIVAVPFTRGTGYRATAAGFRAVSRLEEVSEWKEIAERARLLKSRFDLQGSSLTRFLYEHFPEIRSASWGEAL